MKERPGGELRTEFRMRHADNSYRWFELEARQRPRATTARVRCVGLMREVTDAKRAQERLMHDAVHDSLTGLPNRELFLDRLAGRHHPRHAGGPGAPGACCSSTSTGSRA